MKLRWIVQALVWTGYFAFNLVIFSQFQGMAGFIVALSAVLSLSLWVASEGLRAIVLKLDWPVHGARLALGLAILIPLLAAAVQAVVRYTMLSATELGWLVAPPESDFSAGATVVYWLNTMLTLVLWVAIWLGFFYFQRYRSGEIQRWRAEAERQQLELESLRARLNPHFVFNTLNNLRALITENPGAARDAVTRLSSTLRHALYHTDQTRVTLRDELDVVRDYLALEKLHYEGRLQVDENVGGTALDAHMPPMLLQLLVENAVKHGIARVAGTIDISAAMQDSTLRLTISNPREPGDIGKHPGVGLTYLRAQLARLGDRASFRLFERDDRAIAELQIPQPGVTE